MEEKDLFQDDFLRKMIGKSSLDSPSERFTERIISRIAAETVAEKEKKPFINYLGSIFGILFLVAVIAGFFITSDIPVSNWLPGKTFFTETLLPYFESFIESMISISGSGKRISLPVMIIAAGALFFAIDWFLGKINPAGSSRQATGN